MLPSPPSDVFVLGLPYVRCLFFQRSSSRCVGFASGVPTAFAFELSKTVAFPRLLCTSEVPPNGPNPREVSLPWLSPWTFACAHPPDAWRLSLVFVSVLCVWGGFVLQCAPRPACQRLLGRGATSSLLLFVQHLLTATYGVVLWWSTLLVVGGGTDVSLSRRLASTQCFRRRRATSACSARRTLAVYSSSAVRSAVMADMCHMIVGDRQEGSRTSSDVMEVSQRCRPTGPTHGRSVSLG